ncbi:35361_t:CDS:2, partial [Gigaspora margarita]
KNKGRRDKSKKKHIDVLSDKDEIILDASSPSANEDEISNQIENEMLTEEHVISDDGEVDKIMHNVFSLLNNKDNISNDLTDSIVNPRVIIYPLKANDFHASTTPHGSTITLSINNKSNELINSQKFESTSSQLEGCEIEDTHDYE